MDSATATGSGQVRLQPRREDQRCRSKFVLVPVLVLQGLNGDEGETEREIIPLQSGDNVVETRPPAAITMGGGAAGWDSSVAGTNPQGGFAYKQQVDLLTLDTQDPFVQLTAYCEVRIRGRVAGTTRISTGGQQLFSIGDTLDLGVVDGRDFKCLHSYTLELASSMTPGATADSNPGVGDADGAAGGLPTGSTGNLRGVGVSPKTETTLCARGAGSSGSSSSKSGSSMVARVSAGRKAGARDAKGVAGGLLVGSTGRQRGVDVSPKTATPSSSLRCARGAGSSSKSGSESGSMMTAAATARRKLGARDAKGAAGELLVGSTGKPGGADVSPKTATPSSLSSCARGARSSSSSNNKRGSSMAAGVTGGRNPGAMDAWCASGGSLTGSIGQRRKVDVSPKTATPSSPSTRARGAGISSKSGSGSGSGTKAGARDVKGAARGLLMGPTGKPGEVDVSPRTATPWSSSSCARGAGSSSSGSSKSGSMMAARATAGRNVGARDAWWASEGLLTVSTGRRGVDVSPKTATPPSSSTCARGAGSSDSSSSSNSNSGSLMTATATAAIKLGARDAKGAAGGLLVGPTGKPGGVDVGPKTATPSSSASCARGAGSSSSSSKSGSMMAARATAGHNPGAREARLASGGWLMGSTGQRTGVDVSPKTATPSSSSSCARGAGSSTKSGTESGSGSGTKRRLEGLFTDKRRSSSDHQGKDGVQGFRIPIEIEDQYEGAAATLTSAAASKRRRSKSPLGPVRLVDLSDDVGESRDQPVDLCDSDGEDAGAAVGFAAASGGVLQAESDIRKYLLDQKHDQEKALKEAELPSRIDQQAKELKRYALLKKNSSRPQGETEGKHQSPRTAATTAVSSPTHCHGAVPLEGQTADEAGSAVAAAVGASKTAEVSESEMTKAMTADGNAGLAELCTMALAAAKAAEYGRDKPNAVGDRREQHPDAAGADEDGDKPSSSVDRSVLLVKVGDADGNGAVAAAAALGADTSNSGGGGGGGDRNRIVVRRTAKRKSPSASDLSRQKKEAAKSARLPTASTGTGLHSSNPAAELAAACTQVVQRGTAVTARSKDCSDARVKVSPGDAETSTDDAVALTTVSSTGSPTLTVSRSSGDVGGGGSSGKSPSGGGGGHTRSPTPSARRPARKNVRALGAGGRVLRGDEDKTLTEKRARALLDKEPQKLVGLVYHERHLGYGGWWETTVTGVSSECLGDDSNGGNGKRRDGMDERWPKSVTVGHMHRLTDENKDETASKRKDEAGDDGPGVVYIRKTGGLLSRLRTWDKHREAEREATVQEERVTAGAGNAKSSRSLPKDSKDKSVGPKGATKAGTKSGAAAAAAAAAVGLKQIGKSGSTQKTAAPKRKASVKGAVGGGVERPAAPAPCPVPVPAAELDGGKSKVSAEEQEQEGSEKSKTGSTNQTKASVKKQQAALEKKAAGERALRTCPWCRVQFYLTETEDEADRHLAACALKVSTSAVVANSTLMPPSLSSSLMHGLMDDELSSLVSTVAEFAARRVRPTVAFCDRTMQTIFSSKCRFQTEQLRRIMTSSLEAFPECWQPLNWSRFEETLQALVDGQDNRTLNARVTYLDIALDCLVASRRHQEQQQRPSGNSSSSSSNSGGGVQAGRAAEPLLPPLFLGAGGDQDGRAALKRCSKWAAKVWAKRHAGTMASIARPAGAHGGGNKDTSSIESNVTNARVCMAVSRAMGEALEAFRTAGGGGGGGNGSSSALQLEGCQLVAVELEYHGEVVPSAAGSESAGAQSAKEEAEAREATAKCLAGLVRSLGGRPFCPTLAGVLLQNMPSQKTSEAGVEVERLKALLRRQQTWGMCSGGRGGAGEKGGRRDGAGGGGRGSRAGAKGVQSGSAMLLADMNT